MRISSLIVTKSKEEFEGIKDLWLVEGINPITASSMYEAVNMLSSDIYELIIINACDIDYLPLLSIMRDMTSAMIIVFTDVISYDEQITAFKSGADQFLKWRENIEDNIIQAVVLLNQFSHKGNAKKAAVKYIFCSGILIFPSFHRVFIHDKEVDLSRREFAVLYMLISNPNRIFTSEQIIKRVWGDMYDERDNCILWNTIKRLRQKMKVTSDMLSCIKNVRDIGYRFDM